MTTETANARCLLAFLGSHDCDENDDDGRKRSRERLGYRLSHHSSRYGADGGDEACADQCTNENTFASMLAAEYKFRDAEREKYADTHNREERSCSPAPAPN